MIRLDTVDSTNNYAMRLIDADTAVHGLTILAVAQTAGKGQRGKSWGGAAGESLLMSIIIRPGQELSRQAQFLAALAVAVCEVVGALIPDKKVSIKWPNDILINDKKAAGILIENVVRGHAWLWAVVGIGLNVCQKSFTEDLPNATSLWIATGRDLDIEALSAEIRERIMVAVGLQNERVMYLYNSHLYRRDEMQVFRADGGSWKARIEGMNDQGQLIVKLPDGSKRQLTHGNVEWVWA